MEAYFLGRVPYQQTWNLQERLRVGVLAGGPEVILLCEHPPVLTLGRNATTDDILVEEATLRTNGIDSVRTSRGGRVTYHGPGQLVIYPIVRLPKGVIAHVKWLAAAAVEVAAELGVCATYDRQRIGVFVGTRKLAAIGLHVSRRVAIHGLALNVTREATAIFDRGWFVPCGDAQGQAISLEEAVFASNLCQKPAPVETNVETLALRLLAAFCRQANRPLMHLQTLRSPDLFVK